MKGLLKFITCGSVDDGKSTLIGHILYDAKLLYADQEQALQLDSKVGSRGGAIDYSLLLDGLMAEREQGITIDVAYRYFSTKKRSFIVADTPGHEEYTRNMAVGASFADLAIILVDAVHGVLVQTRRHSRICSLMGIKHFIFAVNKMDLASYSEERFNEVKKQIEQIVKELSLSDVTVIPVSATEGDNVTKHTSAMPWYKGETILEHLENVETDSSESRKESFILPVQRVCRPNHDFRGFMGQIEEGSISLQEEIISLPSREKARVKKIIRGFEEVKEAHRGQAVNIVLDREVDVSRGCLLTQAANEDKNICVSDSLEATILWMDDAVLENGKNFFVKLGTRQIPGLVTGIQFAVDVNSGEKRKVTSLKKNEIARVELSLTEPLVISEFKKHKTLGELILIDRITNMTSACGVVEKITGEAKTYSGKVDRRRRESMKVQKALGAEFILGENGVTGEVLSLVEKTLAEKGRHTYLYTPRADEDFVSITEHLVDAGLLVLLALDRRLPDFERKVQLLRAKEWYLAKLQENLTKVSAEDLSETLFQKSSFASLDNSDYVI